MTIPPISKRSILAVKSVGKSSVRLMVSPGAILKQTLWIVIGTGVTPPTTMTLPFCPELLNKYILFVQSSLSLLLSVMTQELFSGVGIIDISSAIGGGYTGPRQFERNPVV